MKENSLGDVLVGVAGWSYGDWKGLAYEARERDKLRFISRYVDCIEINSSFYRPLSPHIAERWLGSVSEAGGFRFIAKLWQRFTHRTEPPFSGTEVELFKEGLRPLKESGRLLALLVQFPFYFRNSKGNRELLCRLADSFSEYERVVELRDRSWSVPDALQFIAQLDYNVACLDMPLTGSSFRETAIVTGPIGYLRLHGRNRAAWFSREAGRDEKYDYLYSDEEVEQQLHRVYQMQRRAQTVVVIWNNHFRAKAVVNAVQSIAKLRGCRVKAPPLLVTAYPELEAVAVPEPGRLF